MLIGRFGDTTGSPYLEARVLFPRLKVAVTIPPAGEADVSFLADTGADRTTIMPADLARLSIYEHQLHNQTVVNGVSGQGIAYLENAIVSFSDASGDLKVYDLDIMIMKPYPVLMATPSLLGRDIMSNWSVTFNRPGGHFTARVIRADHTFKVPKGSVPHAPLKGVSPPIIRS